MTLNLGSTLCLVAAITLAACQSQPMEPPHEWGIKAQSDLTIAHNMMLESHPGPVDSENPGFMKQAQAAFDHAMKLAAEVNDEAGYDYVLLAYSAGFRDGHFVVFPKRLNEGDVDTYWPGMIPAWRADTVRIAYTDPKENKFQNATLISCDGRLAEPLILNNVFQFDTGKPEQEAYWAQQSFKLFLDQGNPLIKRPKQCVFKLASGQTKTHRLEWRDAPDNFWQEVNNSKFGGRPDIGIEEIRPGEFWINLSDFSPNEDDIKKYREMFADIKARRDELRNAKSIVFDMRGNQGGSSVWANETIEALWGESYPASREVDLGTFVEWRVSQANVNHMDFIVDYLIKNGHEDVALNYYQKMHEGAKQALEDGQDLFREIATEDDTADPKPAFGSIPNTVSTPVYLLTHGTCASACLGFADQILALENVTHIGYPTSSDTNYMEVRIEDKASEDMTIVIPTKVYRHRARKSGEVYKPEFKYDGFDWSDGAIKAWAKTITDQKTR